MRKAFLPFSPPCIGEEEIAEVVDTLRSQWITTGPKTKAFEQQFGNYVGSQAVLALNSCTAGLHLALASAGIGPGDEVITTPITFAASVNVIEHVGARPVLVDVDADTLNINAEHIEAAVNSSTRAIIAVHYAGHPVDLDAVHEIASRHGLVVLEDAAHAVSALYKGRLIGSGDNPVAFSFYATKNITTGEGGILTGSADLIERARVLSLHGMSRDAWKRYDKGGSFFYEIVAPGFKYNMTDVQAALGLHQLRKLARFQERRSQIVDQYNEAFAGVEAVEMPTVRPEVEHAWHLYVLRIRKGVLSIDRDQFVEEMKLRNIGVSVHFIPIHLHRYYHEKYGWLPRDFPIAYDNFQRIVSLPLNPAMSDQDVSDVIEAVYDIARKFTR